MQCLAVMRRGEGDHTSDESEDVDSFGPLPVLRSDELPRSLNFENAVSYDGRLAANTRRSGLLENSRPQSILSYKLNEPKMVTFVRNGDRYFSGVKMNVSQRNFRTWSVLLAELSRSINLPAGVRQIFTPENGHRVTELTQLEPQKTYVCASNEPFKKIDYSTTRPPSVFQTTVRAKLPTSLLEAAERNTLNDSMYSTGNEKTKGGGHFPARNSKRSRSRRPSIRSIETVDESLLGLSTCQTSVTSLVGSTEGFPSKRTSPLKNQSSPSHTAKLVRLMVFKDGPPPRRSVNVPLNKSAISSWEQVRCLISDSLGVTNGCVHLFRPDGQEVRSLSQLWKAGNVLVAAGAEGFDVGEFMIGAGMQAPQQTTAVKQLLSPLPLELSVGVHVEPSPVVKTYSVDPSTPSNSTDRKLKVPTKPNEESQLEMAKQRSSPKTVVSSELTPTGLPTAIVLRERKSSLPIFPTRRTDLVFPSPPTDSGSPNAFSHVPSRERRLSYHSEATARSKKACADTTLAINNQERKISLSRVQQQRPPRLSLPFFHDGSPIITTPEQLGSVTLTPKRPSRGTSIPVSTRRKSLTMPYLEGESTDIMTAPKLAHYRSSPSMLHRKQSEATSETHSDAASTSCTPQVHAGTHTIQDNSGRESDVVTAAPVQRSSERAAPTIDARENTFYLEDSSRAPTIEARKSTFHLEDSSRAANEQSTSTATHTPPPLWMATPDGHQTPFTQTSLAKTPDNGDVYESPTNLERGLDMSSSSYVSSDVDVASQYPQQGSPASLSPEPLMLSMITKELRQLRQCDSVDSLTWDDDRADTPSSCSSLEPMRMHTSNLSHSQTPESDLMGEAPQSVIDMILQSRSMTSMDDQSALSCPQLFESEVRTVRIQSNDELTSTIERGAHSSAELGPGVQPPGAHLPTNIGSHTSLLDSLSQEKLNVTRDKYKIGRIMAEGTFATVKSCQDKYSKKRHLLKVINKAKVFGQEDLIARELEIVRLLRHEYIVQVVDSWETSDADCLVMETIRGGDLFDTVLNCQHFSEPDAAKAMWELGLALVYLHAHKIVHRDIKPENIFLCLSPSGDDWQLKLGGFSLATRVSEPLSLVCNTQYYRAPEMLNCTGYGTKVDTWSSGVICYILLSGTMPFGRRGHSHLLADITYGRLTFPSSFWASVSLKAKDFIRRLLEVSPQQRHCSSMLLQHPWLTDRSTLKWTDKGRKLSRALLQHVTQAAAKNTTPALLTATALDRRRALMKENAGKNMSRKKSISFKI